MTLIHRALTRLGGMRVVSRDVAIHKHCFTISHRIVRPPSCLRLEEPPTDSPPADMVSAEGSPDTQQAEDIDNNANPGGLQGSKTSPDDSDSDSDGEL